MNIPPRPLTMRRPDQRRGLGAGLVVAGVLLILLGLLFRLMAPPVPVPEFGPTRPAAALATCPGQRLPAPDGTR